MLHTVSGSFLIRRIETIPAAKRTGYEIRAISGNQFTSVVVAVKLESSAPIIIRQTKLKMAIRFIMF